MPGQCLGDSGYVSGEGARSGALIAAATAKALAAGVQAKKIRDHIRNTFDLKHEIKEKVVKIEEEQQAHLRNVFWPKELAFLSEFTQPADVPEIEAAAHRHGGRLAATVAGAFAKELRKFRCSGSRYCTSARIKGYQDLLLMQARAVTNAKLMGWVEAFVEVERKKDRADKQRLQAIGLGRGLMGEAAKLYGQSLEGLTGLSQRLGNALGSSLESLGAYTQQLIGNKPGPTTTLGTQPLANSEMSPDSSSPMARHKMKNFLGDMMNGLDNLYADSGVNFESSYYNESASQSNAASTASGTDYLFGMTRSHSNNAKEDNLDLVPVGYFTFPTAEGDSVVVDLGQFALQNQANKDPGDYNTPPYGIA